METTREGDASWAARPALMLGPGRSGLAPSASWPRSASARLEVKAAHREPQQLGWEDARGGSGGSDGGGRGIGPGSKVLVLHHSAQSPDLARCDLQAPQQA